MSGEKPLGYHWRSSKWFIVSTISIALFAETFLYGFLVPILGYMFESRLHTDPSQTQYLTSTILALHGFCCAVSGPLIGHFADKSSNRKSLLLMSLGGCVVGTVMVAFSHTLWLLFLGRVFQGVAGSFVWIVGLATAAETVGESSMGTVIGVIMSFANAGVVGGPMVSGLMLEVAGYWAIWSIPLVVLTVDFIARLIMIGDSEKSKKESANEEAETVETTGLLGTPGDSQDSSTTLGFWRTILCNGRVLTALLISVSTVSLNTSFHATLPLHVKDTFGWGTGTIGFLFFCLSIPSIIITPLAGWLRDRSGLRVPAAITFLIQAVTMGILGIAGSNYFSLAETQGPAIYMTSIIVVGIVQPFVFGVAPIELAAVVKEKQEQKPGIFGPRGGFARIFSMTEVATTLGLIIGPILSGSLTELVGYTYMSWTWSVLHVMLAILAFRFLEKKSQAEDD
ncbi:hypothetical protein N7475_004985 [Penicillium sp. IBT 31633x]|nr:hypothetical protein N7475_004985 [Penicillium sp. IBT 31633x]